MMDYYLLRVVLRVVVRVDSDLLIMSNGRKQDGLLLLLMVAGFLLLILVAGFLLLLLLRKDMILRIRVVMD